MKTFPFESKSSPGKFYTTVLHDDGSIVCDPECRGYRYSKTIPPSCTHTKAVYQQEFEGKPISKTLTNINLAVVKPMLASTLPEGLTIDDYPKDDWLLEEKYDGHRIILEVSASKVNAWSRVGNERELPAHILVELRSNWGYGVYDTELYVPGGTATDVKALDKPDLLRMAVFDVLKIGAEMNDCMQLNTENRRQVLQAMTKTHVLPLDAPVLMAPQVEPSRETLQAIWDRGGEGAILKLRSGLYQPNKRSKDWVKFKKPVAVLTEVIGFEAGKLGPFSRIVVRAVETGFITSVKTLNDAWRAAIAANPDRFVGQQLMISTFGLTSTGSSYVSPMADHFVGIDI